MAAAAYAFLVSLLNTMDQIQLHSRLSTCFDTFQFQSLRQKVDFLVDFVENHSDVVVGENIDAESTEGEALLSRIAVSAQMVEDKIEVEAADRIRDGSTEKSPSFFHDLENMIRGMDSIMEEVMKMKEERRFADRQHTSTMAAPSSSTSSSSSTAKTTVVVGFNGYLERMLDELTGYQSGRQILPIVGMGGIGKTTLARTAYEHSLTLHHFDVRAWVTVSQAFSVTNILSQALSSLGASTTALDDDGELGQKLHKSLFGRRYLIVLDDKWIVEAWEKIMLFFLDNGDRSRIVVTTREREVVDYFRSSAIAVGFLNKNDSWEIFCGKAFAGEGCPPELEEVGRKIVEKCKGLPLAINVIGGLLSKSPRTQRYWMAMAKDKSFVIENSEEGNKALSILYLSYKHMPACLKPCFLYLGLFPEDHRIDPSFLVSLWVAEGFVKPNTSQILEQVAESYIKEFVDRNLLLVGPLTLEKEVKFYSIHDLVRELCIRIGEKEQFYCVQRDIYGRRHFIVDERSARLYPRSESLTSSKRPSVMKPLILDGQREAPFKSRLLRVLVDDANFLTRPFQLVNLRFYFDKSIVNLYKISPISLCWSLQTIFLKETRSVILPSEIWKMPQLRHIDIPEMHLPNPPPPDDNDSFALHNLQTLKRVNGLNFTEDVCKRIPNIKELRVAHHLNEQSGCNFSCLNNLESLHYRILGEGVLLQGLTLPSSLKELNLWNWHLVQSDMGHMAMIASLPHLQILMLAGWNFDGGLNTTWDCVEGEFIFVSLKHLLINKWENLKNWVADSSNFPVLETLRLWDMKSLKEIPSSFGEITTLEKMELSDCSDSTIMCAINIQREQESLGNVDFQLTLNFLFRSEARRFWRAKIQESGITSQNVRII